MIGIKITARPIQLKSWEGHMALLKAGDQKRNNKVFKINPRIPLPIMRALFLCFESNIGRIFNAIFPYINVTYLFLSEKPAF